MVLMALRLQDSLRRVSMRVRRGRIKRSAICWNDRAPLLVARWDPLDTDDPVRARLTEGLSCRCLRSSALLLVIRYE